MLSPQHITKGAALALTVGAFAAPVASAAPIADYSRQDKQVSPSTQQGLPPILPAPNPSQSAAIQRAEQQAAQGRAHTLPNSATYSNAETNAYLSRSPVLPVKAQDGGFDWGDAGIGAAGGLVLSIVAIGGGLVLVQRRERQTGSTAVAIG
jgi:hypothetical protein